MTLSPVEQRLLGSLIEKEISTPENYPLSLNALQSACNQRSSRDPVMDLAEEDLRQALHHLTDLGLVNAVRDARVPKWEHRARSVFQLRRDEIAVVCLLLLRGPQTPGELRSRADRLYSFTDLDAVVGTLERLAAETSATPESSEAANTDTVRPLVALLPRQPGAREARYRHLLGEGPAVAKSAERGSSDTEPALSPRALAPELATFAARLAELEARVARLEAAQLAAGTHPLRIA